MKFFTMFKRVVRNGGRGHGESLVVVGLNEGIERGVDGNSRKRKGVSLVSGSLWESTWIWTWKITQTKVLMVGWLFFF